MFWVTAETQKELEIVACCISGELSQAKSYDSEGEEEIGLDVNLDELSGKKRI